MDRPILEIRNLKTYFYVDGKELRAVDGLSYSVNRGECVAVVGESASGKSVSALSVLRLVADPPGRIVGGEILLDGVDLLKLSEREIRKIRGNRIAMVFQEDRLVDSLTVRANLRLALGAGYDPADAQALLNELDLPDALRRTVGALSGGMKRRVALARALLYDAPLLVLDEPFKGLDETTARQCMDALARRAAGRAVLLVTHDAQEGDYLHARTLQMEKLQRV